MTLRPDTWTLIDAILATESDSFVDLVRVSGLKPDRAFRGADLRGTDFGDAELSGFNFMGADLRGADLSRAGGLTPAMFAGAIFDGATKLPRAQQTAIRQQARFAWPQDFWPDGQTPTWADHWGVDAFGRWVSFSVLTADSTNVSQRMRWIPPGDFMMGSPDGEAGRYEGESPRHRETIAGGFWLFDTPCTQSLWQAVTGDNPSAFKSLARPVEQVSFRDVQAFMGKLNTLVPGLELSLPSEARWEYTCRAGTETATYAGDLEFLGVNNAPVLDPIVWYGGNSGDGFELENGLDPSDWRERQYAHTKAGTRVVAHKAANAWGLHDMLGNVWEWCADEWHDSYLGAPTDGSTWGTERGAAARVVRGGSWGDDARNVRAACRNRLDPASRGNYVGFRCVRVQSAGEQRPAVRDGGGDEPEAAARTDFFPSTESK
jgi:formylglycine-generating enzyme required for sulfatase activity